MKEYKFENNSEYFTNSILNNSAVKNIKKFHIYKPRSFLAQTEYIKDNFRNKSAHAGNIDKRDAEDCCNIIMGRFEDVKKKRCG